MQLVQLQLATVQQEVEVLQKPEKYFSLLLLERLHKSSVSSFSLI